MNNIVIKCGGCQKKLLTYNSRSPKRYKGLVESCKKCGKKYIDPRCHEIALWGIPEDVFDTKQYFFLLAFGAFILYRGYYLFGRHQLGTPDEMQWIMPAFLSVFGIVSIVSSIVQIVRIKTGAVQKKFEKYRAESEARMEDKSYLYILSDLGVNIPERYL